MITNRAALICLSTIATMGCATASNFSNFKESFDWLRFGEIETLNAPLAGDAILATSHSLHSWEVRRDSLTDGKWVGIYDGVGARQCGIWLSLQRQGSLVFGKYTFLWSEIEFPTVVYSGDMLGDIVGDSIHIHFESDARARLSIRLDGIAITTRNSSYDDIPHHSIVAGMHDDSLTFCSEGYITLLREDELPYDRK